MLSLGNKNDFNYRKKERRNLKSTERPIISGTPVNIEQPIQLNLLVGKLRIPS